MRNGFVILTFLGVLVLTAPAYGDVIYSNLGTGSSVYDCCNGGSIEGNPAAKLLFQSFLAMSFTPSANYDHVKIDLALGWSSGTNEVIVSLQGDTGSNAPSSAIYWGSGPVTNLPVLGTCCTLQTFTLDPNSVLSAGKQYWIGVRPGADDTLAAWNLNNTGAKGNYWDYQQPTFTGVTNAAFDVSGTLITPEPSTGVFLATGLLALFGVAHKGLLRLVEGLRRNV